MSLTMTKYHENLLSDSPLSLLFIVKLFSSLETKMILKAPNETFLRITREQPVDQIIFGCFTIGRKIEVIEVRRNQASLKY